LEERIKERKEREEEEAYEKKSRWKRAYARRRIRVFVGITNKSG